MAKNDELILGMDIGGTNTRSGFVSRDKNVYHFSISKSKEVFGRAAVSDFVAYAELLLRTPDVAGKPVKAISIGFPSSVDKHYRKIFSTPNIEGLDDIEMADILERKFGIPTFINRDVCMLMYYDMYANNLPKDIIVIACYIGTGFGNSIYINGKLLTGKNGVAAELGHIPIYGIETVCGCGNRGCVEAIASGKHLAELHREHFSDADMDGLFEAYGGHPLLKRYVKALALPVATEINIFDPHYVLLGGGVLQMKGFPKNEFEARIIEHTRKPYPACNLEFIYSVEGKTNGVVGAGIFGYEQLDGKGLI